MAVGSFINESETKKKGTILNGNDQQNGVNKPSTSESTMSSRDKSSSGFTKRRNKGPKAVAIPPDGGWGWVVAFSSFMVSFVLDGVCFTFGFFFTDFQSYFGANKSITSFISSCLNGTYMITGPIASALVNMFGCRKVAMFGSIMTSAAFFMSTFSPNVEIMILIYGVCGGIGFGLMYLPAIVMVGYYFDKRRALATGIAVCGSGIGGFLFAPLTEGLLQQYHWKGSLWIISGLILNGVVFASLYRPLEVDEGTETNESEDTESDKAAVIQKLLSEPENPIYRCKSLDIYNYSSNYDNNLELARLGHSMFLDIEPRTRKHRLNIHTHVQSPLLRKDVLYTGSLKHIPEYKMADTKEEYVRSMLSINGSATESQRSGCNKAHIKHLLSELFDVSLLRSITFMIYNFSCFLCMMGFFVPFIYIPAVAREQGMTSTQTTWIISTIGIVNTVGRVIAGYISDKEWCDAILVNVISLVVAGVSTLFVPYYNIYAVLVLYGIMFGFGIEKFTLQYFVSRQLSPPRLNYCFLGQNVKSAKSTVGLPNPATSEVTRVRLPTDQWTVKERRDAILVNVISLVVAGVSTLFVPYYNIYAVLVLYGIMFGFGIAAFVSLRSIIIVDLFGIDKLTNSFGIVVLSQGLSTFIGAPIAGALSDATGNYMASFYLAGAVITLSGLICIPLRRINRWEKERAMKKKCGINHSEKVINTTGENQPMVGEKIV